MSKLFKLKEWLTLDEVVKHIANVLGEPITLADIYRLALDGNLKLSAYFVNGVYAKKTRFVKTENLKYRKVVPVGLPNFPECQCISVPINGSIPISKNYWVEQTEPEVILMRGVWDLAMKGAERADISNRYQQEVSGLSVKIPIAVGHYVELGDTAYQLHVKEKNLAESEYDATSEVSAIDEVDEQTDELRLRRSRRLPSFYPATNLDELDAVLVVRTAEVTRFIQSLEDESTSKPLNNIERNTLLVLIGALCKEANVDWNQRGISASLVAMTDLIGAPVTDDTVRKVLKQIGPAIDARS
ncbi:hypothetical protein Shewmr4_2785 [Shewanella sp. MR-4]|uniref:hypothetical protein n=1 Tax=Shewanella sp. (strain MR-4) TaxID=60480 RepID=UPI00005E5B6B|nr:hypothetical protein [Shewanella sp. MR-4]ABI39856.1 hypothetical protein Shewmr4_2785 [Shewanella sp. MR-4]